MAKLERQFASINKEANVYYLNTTDATNDFDSVSPWKDIQETEPDAQGNIWIKIPKFYTKYVLDENGVIKERYISIFNGGTGWHLNPLFLNENGKEIDEVYISKYLLTDSNNMYKSLSGATPIQNKTPTEARTKIAYYNNTLSDGYNYCLFDIWALIALQDLCIVEFANSSAQSIVKGYTERGTQLGSTGMMDNIGNKTPIQTTGSRAIDAQQDESGNYSMKYRGIENLWGYGRTFIDGLKVKDNKFHYSTNILEYNLEGSYTAVSNSPLGTGYVWKLSYDENSKLVLPVELSNASNNSYADFYSVGSDGDCYFHEGLYGFLAGNVNNKVYRMMKKPE